MALILAVNAGSSSLKITLFRPLSDDRIAEELLVASISSIQSSPTFKLSASGASTINEDVTSISNHSSAFAYFLDAVRKRADINLDQIRFICHRVVHGGDFREPVKIDERSYSYIKHFSNLAPLHNGAALSVIQACIEQVPHATSIAYFDTSFHRTIPPHIYSYAINQEIATKRGLRKYGFHGLSYAYILRETSKHFNKAPESLNLIIMHLGAGASVCAIRYGVSLDTSMGLTPLDGLPGATRSGTVDPSLIFHYTNKAGKMSHDPNLTLQVGITQAEDILNRKAGWKSITGSANFRDIAQNANLAQPPREDENNPFNLAFHLFVDRVLDFVGAFHLKLGADVDALVFAGGVGERSRELRQVVGKAVECLQYQPIDQEKNANVVFSETVNVVEIGAGGTEKGRIFVCQTDEQFEMARECIMDVELW
ncbi:hypothetical protein AX14_006358 [Amanita brunnescens Koide BX004]|nr:hypothetical protein AX14_006358 [Amanita brunnescens Koide BX004]